MRVQDLEAIRIKLASPEEILNWSHGEVTKPETINYRTQRAEKDGLFCEKIFGPTKDYECYCGKYKRIRYKGIVCDRCGVEVTKAAVRRERMGHIKLASPCSHIWFLRGVPSRMGMILDIPMQQLEKVIYFASYIITSCNEDARKKVLEEIEKEYKRKSKAQNPNDKSNTERSEVKKRTKFSSPPKAKIKEKKIKLGDLKTARDLAIEEVSNLKPLKTLSEVDYHRLSLKYGEVFEAGTGAEILRKIFEKTDLKKQIEELKKELETAQPLSKRKILARLEIFQGMSKAGIRPEWMFLTVLPILPPDLRPMVQLDGGRYASSDLNDLYRRVINRNNRLKYLLEIGAPEVIVRNERRMLQEAVDALIDNGMRKGTMTTATTGGKRLLKSLADILKGKRGRFRQNLLGKRVDYSGRSVIVVGTELKLNEVGIPKKMALELFKPFVIKKLLDKELVYNVRSASRLIEQETDEVWASLEEVVKDKLVLLNRAPTLHRLGVQAFYPKLIEGESIRIHPMVCRAFNADFDGDQMAVHLPLSETSQKEAKEIMLSTLNLLKPATGTPVLSINQDIILGCYFLTQIVEEEKDGNKIFGSKEEAILAYEFGDVGLQEKIKARLNPNETPIKTSVGRIIFNEALPDNFPFHNSLIKVKDLEGIVREIIKKYDFQKTGEILDKIKELGFEYSTWAGISWGMDDLIVPPEKENIIAKAEKGIEEIEEHFRKGLLSREEKSSKVIEIWSRVKTEIEELVPKTLPQYGSVFQIIDSGAKGSWGQLVQMAGMKGLVINPAGQIIELPVKSSFKEGFDVLEYFISTHGARKGTADTALRTSTAGYLTRRLVDVAHEVIVTEEDCGDNEGFIIWEKDADEIGQNFIYKILGRINLENIKGICKEGEIIDWEKAEKIAAANIEKVRIRSPLSCKSVRGVCQKCYGWDLGNNQLIKLGEAVGIVAAQSIGEPGTQLTMRTFHTGGVAGGGDITMGLPRVQEIFETRVPGGKAEISQVDGKVLEITQDRVIRIKSKSPASVKTSNSKAKSKKSEIVEYKIPAKVAIWVNPGQEVKKGQQLCEGSLDLKELFKLAGEEETQRYIVKEIQKIYVSQGAIIHDKHIETICRQMFSRVRIKDLGDSSFSIGEIVERTKFLEENTRLKKEKKKPVKGVPILLGISRVALTTDSFLSAASFQETSRVLIKASLEGKEDKLRGLKENVIIGKLIPAGTGLRKEKK
ncbi:MAG: DNA-directed RNA polymerase subunit beta' [Candidatus Nealsonbacteria bacterium CG02_land_8_20_14_3_00_37_10]|uniref:DNA-directed RNA polymerase subunit beta' n=1 Tax=Candidatus Nealsonbacteria bacterium CG02_land_8_20_14_3_00_37_10 TaxID=1974699 RepID=A0A2M7D9P1_9BACT|nr:MAG: DNA-directed RNA polymerase subunit beta' [Candidatus Nealsonbacteria bacterium CG02_land_8_20_14_3_00_37_10]